MNYFLLAKYDVIVIVVVLGFFLEERGTDENRFFPSLGGGGFAMLFVLVAEGVEVTLKKLFMVLRFVVAQDMVLAQIGARSSSVKVLPAFFRALWIVSSWARSFSSASASDGNRTPTIRRDPTCARMILSALSFSDLN